MRKLLAFAAGPFVLAQSCSDGDSPSSRAPDSSVTICDDFDAGSDVSSANEAGRDDGGDAPPEASSSSDAPAEGSSDGGGISVCRVARPDGAAPVTLSGCAYASPLAYEAAGGTEVLLVAGETLTAFSLEGELVWSLILPAPEGERALAVATPVRIGDRLVVSYHTHDRANENEDVTGDRIRHLVSVVDLAGRRIDTAFEPLELDAQFPANEGVVDFTAKNALGRAALVHVPVSSGLGLVYVTFGNARDIQPWHGFIFELDLDAWQTGGTSAAISSAFISTPESDCGTEGVSGSRSRICGGGMWAPSGPLLVERAGGHELFVSTGNGQLDLARNDFANSVLRLTPGLGFDPACDPTACATFDPDMPALDCVASCKNLFIPRETPGDPFPIPESGACDGLTLFECWEGLDYIGGSTPTYLSLPSGTEVLAYPAKDGALYLFDADHLGTMYDRKQLVSICGTRSDTCSADWAGMIVTQPALTESTGEPLLLVPTFMFDKTHPAGVVAVAVTETDEGPKLAVRWQAPSFDSPEALTRFRRHSSRIRFSHEGRYAWVVEAATRSNRGRLIGIRIADGAIVVDEAMLGPGMRYTQPLLVGDRLFAPSCAPHTGPSTLEIYDIIDAH